MGDQLSGLAENAVYIGVYEVPGDEAVTATSAAAAVLRTMRPRPRHRRYRARLLGLA
jgi:hypothetical protein